MNEKNTGGLKEISSSFDRGLEESATYPTHDPLTSPPLHVLSFKAARIIGFIRGVRMKNKISRWKSVLLQSLACRFPNSFKRCGGNKSIFYSVVR
jgi:hypothetical protein